MIHSRPWGQSRPARAGTISPAITCLGFVGALAVSLFSGHLRAEVELAQADGGILTLPQPARRIITLAPHLTELAFAAGAGAQVVATVAYSEYPPAAVSIPRVGDAFRLDLERILTLKPGLVVAWQSGNPPAAVTYLQDLGIPVWTVEIRRPEEIATVLEAMGRATGNEPTASAAAAATRRRIAELAKRYGGVSEVSYFYQVAVHPLYTINGEHLISRSLELCGGENIFGDAVGLAPQVSPESVIAADPQALLAPSGPGQQDALAWWRDWPGLRAVRADALYLLPEDEISRATPRMLDAVAAACKLLDTLRAGSPDE